MRDALAPNGWVTIRGEVWRAEVEAGGAAGPVAAGRKVRVQSVDGRTLRVVPVSDA